MYRESASAVKRGRKATPDAVMQRLPGVLLTALYFAGLPLLIIMGVHWVVYAFTVDSVYRDAWMAPTLLLGSGFISGILIRHRIERGGSNGMGLFLMGILSLIGFSYMTYHDIHTLGGLYSHWLPRPLSYAIQDYVWFLPGVGVAGMLFHHFFMLRQES